ncbi:MAG TPA: helix-turn-helix transcriptional regulator [Candidatus Saccharimonadales bacterium]|nr:helix-turn-helix transcriptional regulator [Candidatus Saccharimonadales bacterium]
MTRRKIIQEGQAAEYQSITTAGPMKYYNKKLVKVPGSGSAREETFVPINAEWFKAIVEEIAPARRRKYLTQRQLAHFMRTSQSMISMLENGQGNPTVEFLERLFKVLGLEVEIKIKSL